MSLTASRNIAGSVGASTLRLWQGTMGSRKEVEQTVLPVLYDRESDPACRLVRESLTALNLDVDVRPVPQGSVFHRMELDALGGRGVLPTLHFPDTGEVVEGAEAINRVLFSRYGRGKVPRLLRANRLNLFLSELASRARGARGTRRVEARRPEQALTLYSFESSPYSRPVRELLCELEIPYRLINISKQQRADLGPAICRLHLGEYQPIPGSKRDRTLREKGRVQAPYLIDPNSGQEVWESERVLTYLKNHYVV